MPGSSSSVRYTLDFSTRQRPKCRPFDRKVGRRTGTTVDGLLVSYDRFSLEMDILIGGEERDNASVRVEPQKTMIGDHVGNGYPLITRPRSDIMADRDITSIHPYPLLLDECCPPFTIMSLNEIIRSDLFSHHRPSV
jgi:hypothetical protein